MSGLLPFFTYYGGKFRVAPKYPAPAHDLIVEPFAGSAGYSLRYPERAVRLVAGLPGVAHDPARCDGVCACCDAFAL